MIHEVVQGNKFAYIIMLLGSRRNEWQRNKGERGVAFETVFNYGGPTFVFLWTLHLLWAWHIQHFAELSHCFWVIYLHSWCSCPCCCSLMLLDPVRNKHKGSTKLAQLIVRRILRSRCCFRRFRIVNCLKLNLNTNIISIQNECKIKFCNIIIFIVKIKF